MKRIFTVMGLALLSSMAVQAQDSTAIKQKHKTHPTYDTVPNPADSTKSRKWHNDKKPKEQRKNWPDSMGGTNPDSLKLTRPD